MKKKAIISIMIVFVLLFASMPAFADTYGLGSFINEYRHYMVAKFDDKGGYQVFCTNVDDPSEIIVVSEDGNYIHVTAKKGVVRYYTLDYGVTWSAGTQISETVWPMPAGASQKIMESTFNVYTVGGRVFFSLIGPPIMALVETMRGVDSGILWKSISVGLTLLVGLIVLGICFQKAWAFLRSQLMR